MFFRKSNNKAAASAAQGAGATPSQPTAAAATSSAATATTPRDFDVVVYGASGFTGRLVCEHLARDYSAGTPGLPAPRPPPERPTALPQTSHPPVRWAMAGRDAAKMERVARELAERVWGDADLAATHIPKLVADASDPAALERVAARAKVILTTAGPYAKYGDQLVRAAVKARTHYADLTGEVLWARRVADALHDEAAASGTKLVSMSGYDSVPSDAGAWLAADALARRTGKKAGLVVTAIGPGKGGFSGGTVASGLHQAKSEDKGEVRRAMGDAYYLARGVAPFREGSAAAANKALPPLVDAPAPSGPVRTPLGARVAELVAKSTAATEAAEAKVTPPAPCLAPFVMSSINQKVVHRSEALWRLRDEEEQKSNKQQQQRAASSSSSSSPFSPKGLRYLEAMGVPSMAVGAVAAAANLGIGAMFALAPLRALAERTFLPAPGEGPSREVMVGGGYWQHVTYAVADDEDDKTKAPAVAVAVVGDPNRDPGYFGTARMLLEVGLCLALDEQACAEAGALKGGCLTPTTATGGAPLVKRLRAAGLQLEVLAVDEGGDGDVAAAAK